METGTLLPNQHDPSAHSHRERDLLVALRQLGGSARASDLAGALDVSEKTVRRAIKTLSKSGHVVRIRGGAYLADGRASQTFLRRIAQHSDEKHVIAATVASGLHDGMSLFLDVGTTTAVIAEELRDLSNLTIVTNSIGVAQALGNHNGNRLHLLGGEMQRDERGVFGHVTETQLRQFSVDLAILSADALSTNGFLYRDVAEAQLGSIVADCASKVLVAMAHFKFNETAAFRGPDPSDVHMLVVDKAPDGALAAALKGWRVEVHLATGKREQC